MSHNIITECPTCATRFQVTPGQLKIAHGKVRCGECLEVFNAQVYRCDTLVDPQIDLRPVDQLDDLSDTLDNDPLFDQIEVALFTSPDNLSGDDKRYPSSSAQPILPEPLDDDNDVLAAANTIGLSANADADAAAITTIDIDLEQPVSELLPISTAAQPSVAIEQPAANNTTDLTDTLTASMTPTNASPKPTTQSIRPLTDFQAEPLFINRAATPTATHRGWTVLTLIAVLLLLGQYLWFNRQPLSAYSELSAAYQYACQYLPCQLDAPIMLDKIKTQQLLVRQHPDFQGALRVNLRLENLADVAQPYPAILLSFSDRLGQPVSQRTFQPTEYLDTAHTAPQTISPKRSVQIEFEILDPGRRALSYEATLVKPTQPNNAPR